MTVEPPHRTGTTTLPDGRRLGWAEWGPEGAPPVLLFPGAATSRWLGLAAGATDGVRVLSLDRPGLGASDPAPGRTLATWAGDVAELVRLHGLDRPRGIAFSQGAPFGLACAAAGVLGALAVVSGTDELAAPDVREHLLPDVRGLVDLCAREPARARELFAGLATTDAMQAMVLSGSSGTDRAVYEEPTFAAAYRRAMDEAFAQGPDGYTQDTLLSMSRWPFDLGAIGVPVHLWYGRLDTSPVHSPDSGNRLHRLVPGSRHHLLDDEGGFLLWTRSREILDDLLAAG
ncbi:Pimeloyl-ACP methyl ester carboxylesterase [Blastococcus fimeti]|nr:Pimeloyl-ACP methyl ester carboxylesterase [Blastococcus fimeti]